MAHRRGVTFGFHPIALSLLLVMIGLAIGWAGYSYRERASASSRDASEAPTREVRFVISSDRLDFGEIPLDTAIVRPLILRNDSGEVVRLRLEGPAGGFEVDRRVLALGPGDASRVSVTARPVRHGALREELRIYEEDTGSGPVIVVLEAHTSQSASGVLVADGRGRRPGARESGGLGPSTDADFAPEGAAGTAGGSALSSVEEAGAGRPADTKGSVNIVSSHRSADPAAVSPDGTGAGKTSPAAIAYALGGTTVRSISDAPESIAPDAPLREGEEPVPLRRRDLEADADDPAEESGEDADVEDDGPSEEEPDEPAEPEPASMTFLDASTLTVMGSANRFYPQTMPVHGSGNGGPISLLGYVQLPNVPIGFGQSLSFEQSGPAHGTFWADSGQLKLFLPMATVDPNGNVAILNMELTTDTTFIRNPNGIVVSATGQPREPGSGMFRLVDFEQIPPDSRHGAAHQVVIVEIVGILRFPPAASDGAEAP